MKICIFVKYSIELSFVCLIIQFILPMTITFNSNGYFRDKTELNKHNVYTIY